MIEPVAYVQIRDGKAYSMLRKGTPNDEYTPVYTAEQLRPRVKMTQAEFDEFCLLYKKLSNSAVTGIINTIKYNESREFGNLNSLFFKVGGDFKILSLFDKFDIDNPEETIEIVPDFKWFVRNKQKGKDDVIDYLMIDDDVWFGWHPFVTRDEATAFDTKEEAEKWVNPLTEAVQLPVEGE